MDMASFFFSLLMMCTSGDAVCEQTPERLTVCSESFAKEANWPVMVNSKRYEIRLIPGCRET